MEPSRQNITGNAFNKAQLPSRRVLSEWQEQTKSLPPRSYTKDKGHWGSLWMDKYERVWVPPDCEQMKQSLFAIAHQGVAGHRGHDTTVGILTKYFVWKNIHSDVKRLHQSCLQCIRASDGQMIKRPLGTQLVAERPGEVLTFDYLFLGTSKSGYKYVLVMVDKFSKLTTLVPTKAPLTIPAAKAIVEWSAMYVIPN